MFIHEKQTYEHSVDVHFCLIILTKNMYVEVVFTEHFIAENRSM